MTKEYVLGIKIGAALSSTFSETINRAKNNLKNLSKFTNLKLSLDDKIAQARGELSEKLSSWRSMLATAASLAIPIKVGADFEYEMTRVGSLLGATGKQFEALRAKALQLGATTIYSSSQVGQAMEYLAMAGFSVNQILKTVGPTLNLATVGNIDLARAADISSDVLTGFGLKAEDLTRVVDVMSKTITTSNSTVESLGEALKYVAPVAKSLGVSIEETSAMLGLLHNVGIKGSMAGTTLRAMFMRLSAPTGDAAKMLARLGIKVKDATGKMRPMEAILRDIGKRLNELPQGERMMVVKAIFGEEPAAGAIALIKQATTGELERYIQEIEKARGASQKMVGRLNDTVVAKFKAVKSAIENIMLTMYKPIEPLVKFGLDALTKGLRALGSVLKVVAPVVSPVLFVLGSLFLASKLAAIGIALIRLQSLLSAKGLMVLAEKVPFLSSELGVMSKASVFAGMSFGEMFAALKAGSITLLTSPIFWIVGALAVSAFLIIKNWSKVKAFFKGLWAGIKPVFEPFINAFKAILKPIKLVFSWIGKLFGSSGKVDTKKYESFGYKVGKILSYAFWPLRLAGFWLKTLGKVAKWVFNNIGKAAKFLAHALSAPFAPLKLLGGAISHIGAVAKSVFGFLGKIIDWFAEKLNLPLKIFGLLAKGLGFLGNMAKKIFGGLFKVITAPFHAVGSIIGKAFKHPFTSVFHHIFGGAKEKETHTETRIKQESFKEKLEKNNVVKLTKEVLNKEKLEKTLKSESFSKESIFRERATEKERLVEKQSKGLGLHIGPIHININSNRPVETAKNEAPQIKKEIKRVIIEVFNDLRRKQALAYNK